MSKRRTPSNKDSQEVASLLTAAESIAEDMDNTVKEPTLVPKANAKRAQETLVQVEPVITESNPIITTDVGVVEKSSLNTKDIDDQTTTVQTSEKGKDPIQIDSSYTQLLGSTPKANATG